MGQVPEVGVAARGHALLLAARLLHVLVDLLRLLDLEVELPLLVLHVLLVVLESLLALVVDVLQVVERRLLGLHRVLHHLPHLRHLVVLLPQLLLHLLDLGVVGHLFLLQVPQLRLVARLDVLRLVELDDRLVELVLEHADLLVMVRLLAGEVLERVDLPQLVLQREEQLLALVHEVLQLVVPVAPLYLLRGQARDRAHGLLSVDGGLLGDEQLLGPGLELLVVAFELRDEEVVAFFVLLVGGLEVFAFVVW